MKSHFAMVMLLLTPLVSFAQTPTNSDALLQSLSSCDASFFHALKNKSSTFEQGKTLVHKGDIAYWKVSDPKVDGKDVMRFSTPIKGAVPLIGYFDSMVDLDAMGKYYSWGFVAKGSPSNVAEKIRHIILNGQMLKKIDDGYILRSDIRNTAITHSKWVEDSSLKSGTVPKENTAERVLLLENYGKSHDRTLIDCSIQGTITPEILKDTRPDITQ